MERAALTLVVAGALAAAGLAQTPARDSPSPRTELTGTISGRVVAADSGEPIRTARVTVNSPVSMNPSLLIGASGPTPPPRRTGSPSAFTDNNGRFVLAAVPAGPTFLSVTKAGYAKTTFGARRPGIPPIAVDVPRGGRVDAIEIRMAKSGAIAGRIVDEFGEPVEGVVVSAQRILRIEGFSGIMRLADAETDDRGEYRLGGLPVGKFLVTATPRIDRLALRSQALPDGRTVIDVQSPQSQATYYPGVAVLTEAQPIDVRAGEQRTRIDFALGLSHRVKLTVALVDADGNRAIGSAVIASAPDAAVRPLPRVIPRVAAEASTSVEPGTWAVYARGRDGVGTARVTVGSADERIAVTLRPAARVTGRVRTDDGPVPAGLTVEVGAVPIELGVIVPPDMTPSARVHADGTFELTDVFGSRLLQARVIGARGWMPSAVLYQGQNLIDSPIDVRSGEELAGVEIVLSNRLARLRGTVTDESAKAVTDYSVLLFPESQTLLRNPRRLTRWIRPDVAGGFSANEVLPGSYMVIALDDVDDAEWLNADYLTRLRPVATRVELRAGETTSTVLKRADVP